MNLRPLIKTVTEKELAFIASLDYGQDADRHLEALRAVVFQQGGRISEDQCWFPLEVIELGARSLAPGHEREFFFCTMLLLQAAYYGESTVDLRTLRVNADEYYAQLWPELRAEVLLAFQRVLS